MRRTRGAMHAFQCAWGAPATGRAVMHHACRRVGCLAYKAGMTHEWDEHGVRVPLTVLWIDDCQVRVCPGMQRALARHQERLHATSSACAPLGASMHGLRYEAPRALGNVPVAAAAAPTAAHWLPRARGHACHTRRRPPRHECKTSGGRCMALQCRHPHTHVHTLSQQPPPLRHPQVTAVRWEALHGYNALVVGAGHAKAKALDPAVAGLYLKHVSGYTSGLGCVWVRVAGLHVVGRCWRGGLLQAACTLRWLLVHSHARLLLWAHAVVRARTATRTCVRAPVPVSRLVLDVQSSQRQNGIIDIGIIPTLACVRRACPSSARQRSSPCRPMRCCLWARA